MFVGRYDILPLGNYKGTSSYRVQVKGFDIYVGIKMFMLLSLYFKIVSGIRRFTVEKPY